MTSRNWVRFFFAVLALGGVSSGILGFLIRWPELEPYVARMDLLSIVGAFFWFAGVGLIFSLVSQVGFFAYLTVHQLGLDIFRSRMVWQAIQLVAACYVLFDFVYFRADFHQSLWFAAVVLAVSLAAAFAKAKQAKSASAFIPALFFMVAATILEWVPALRVNNQSWLYLMFFPLLICNAFQLLVLPYFLKRSQKEREQKAAMKAAN
ncbi:KinB-signaling pathway activation protein [Weizmannia acidilactici]|uniref:KinB-signaling pathway activation protein n=1 Tax=Weizmannia acidilactici TaxID=2607726 RepID=A0A5J4JHB1_9BACI|nr:KinB-signaling pathway activation protein [Weizmannia acidilactici]GER67215.1 KinB-signaling pathway activation protein [Weizmannia acidilactici]GER69857.1 KinB-signaling pathway activation protein [Weizmannia acidilactici]GER73364.1 KinB-signaling pathway activation protein [Weizmannia acidilactici]